MPVQWDDCFMISGEFDM